MLVLSPLALCFQLLAFSINNVHIGKVVFRVNQYLLFASFSPLGDGGKNKK
jgi:hypothetical protein